MAVHDETDARYALQVEAGVLGAAMLGKAGHDGVLGLQPGEFSTRKHQQIAATLQAIIRRGDEPDWITTSAELDQRGQLNGAGGVGGSTYLSEIVSAAPTAHHGWTYAQQVRQAYRARLLQNAAAELGRATEGGDLEVRISAHRDALKAIPPELNEDTFELPTLADLMEKKFEHRWLVENLLARRERFIITAAEGGSKTTSLSTWAATLAAGLHPFTGTKLERSYRVLLLDAENDEEQTQHRFDWIGRRIDQLGGEPGWQKRIYHQIRPEGFDLVGRDRAWFMSCLAKTSPDLTIIGPAYKAIGAAKTNDDAAILALFAVLDEARIKFDTALAIEAHTGHAKDSDGNREVRPFGSSVWMRWPEVGIGLRRNKDLDPGLVHAEVVDVVHWRGSRGVREWPDQLNRGKDGQLPWVPARSDYTGGFDTNRKKWT